MELNLFPQKADDTWFQGDGGGYYAWTAGKLPVLATAKLGAAKLVLQPRGFALPHYADTSKIGYVSQGTCTAGLVFPNSSQEHVVIIKEGDAIPVEMGCISWWFNGGDTDTTVVFLGESSQSYTPGLFDYFFLTGALSVLRCFSTEFISKIYGLDQSDSEKLVKSQTNEILTKLGEDVNMPRQSSTDIKHYVASLTQGAEITGENFPLLDKVGLSARLVTAKAGCAVEPLYSGGPTYQMIYITKGGGRVQIAGLNGGQALDAAVEEDQVFVVPPFFAVAVLAGESGIEFFCVSTSARPVWGRLGGRNSAWEALSAPVREAALNASPEFVKRFKSKIGEGDGSCS